MPTQQNSNHKLLLDLLKDIKKIQLEISCLRREVDSISQKLKEDNISIVQDESSASWFWGS